VTGAFARTVSAPRVRLGVLNNLRAGRNFRQRDDMRQLVGAHRDVVYLETEGAPDVGEALATFARREVTLVAVGGGDGTLQHVLTALLRSDAAELPLVAPLAGGRTNMSARGIGCARPPLQSVGRLAAAAGNGGVERWVVEQPVLRVHLGADDGVQYGMFCSPGVIHRAVDLVHRVFPPGRSQGTFAAGTVTGLLLARAALRSTSGMLAPDAMAIRLDGRPLPQTCFKLALMTTLARMFLRLNPFWGREPAPVRLTAVAHPARRVAASVVGVLRGRPGRHVRPENGYTSRNVERAELTLDCGVMIDGELFPPRAGRHVRVEADHRVRFVQA
jgi:hypothetical protein